MEGKSYFNEPKFDLNDLALFPPDIYERTKQNPNPKVSAEYVRNTNSLDEYADRLAQEIVDALRG
ncbi:hypothetical protein FACS189461_0770 [Spirochaetia bacterium]|nr:hypothetical protein FACS189461_0770 [Spirochaetia bacterium]